MVNLTVTMVNSQKDIEDLRLLVMKLFSEKFSEVYEKYKNRYTTDQLANMGTEEEYVAEWTEKELEVLYDYDKFTVLAKSDGKPSGYIIGETGSQPIVKNRFGYSSLKITRLYIEPEYRDTEVGQCLLENMLIQTGNIGGRISSVEGIVYIPDKGGLNPFRALKFREEEKIDEVGEAYVHFSIGEEGIKMILSQCSKKYEYSK